MKASHINFFLILILALFSPNLCRGQENVLQIFDGVNYNPVPWDKLESITYDDKENSIIVTIDDDDIKIRILEEGSENGILMPSGKALPLIEIFTDEFLEEIQSKTDYESADFILSGFGEFEDIEKRVSIRGRGNSSWSFEKKPYRLKFDKKVSLCGLPSAKSYVLLANYTDNSLTQNALAFKIGQMLELPYTNQCVPVDVKLNGIYKGSYILTNKPGINSGSVDISEENSIMWELDTNFDEDLKFRSPLLNLPVMVSDPDLNESEFEYWKNDFIRMEEAVVNGDASAWIDMDILARYILVFEILKNEELGWPKSVKLFKEEGGKYIFGPLWDFDTAMGKIWKGESYTTDEINQPVWKNSLVTNLEDNPAYIEAMAKWWEFIKPKLPELLEFIDTYTTNIYNSAIRNQQIWEGLEDFEECVAKMKSWLSMRFEALDKLL